MRRPSARPGSVVGAARVAYLAVLFTACRTAPGALIPEAAAPVSEAQVSQWVAATVPDTSLLYRFKWLFRDERSSAGGRGSVRVAPTDTLRFDAAGPFGSHVGSAVVVGDRPLWAQPPDAVRKLVPNYPLMWGMVGIARRPAPGAALRGLARGEVTAWQYAAAGDTVAYLYERGNPTRLVTDVRERGQVVGRAETVLGPDGLPRRTTLLVPSVPARLDLTFLSTQPRSFAPDTWLAPDR